MNRKTFLVGVDGSQLAYGAMRLACCLAGPQDAVRVVHYVKADEREEQERHAAHILDNCRVEMRKYKHLSLRRCSTDVVEVPNGWAVAGKIRYDANHIENGAGILVVGSSGKGDQDGNKPRPRGFPPMGSIAEELMIRVKVPIVICRGANDRVTMPQDSIASTRVGRNPAKRSGLTFGAAVDSSKVSTAAFDLAMALCTENEVEPDITGNNDDLRVFHVTMEAQGFSGLTNPDQIRARQLALLKSHYETECAKAQAQLAVESATFSLREPAKGRSVKEEVVEAALTNHVDVLFLGSVELSQPGKKIYLGSTSSALARECPTHVCIVKNFTST